jgi:hypothetical protein
VATSIVSLDREVMTGVMWAGCAAGLIMCGSGWVRARTQSLLMGMTIAFYSLTGATYVPLIGSPAEPLSVIDRMWGAMTAVIAGGAVLGVVATNSLSRRDADADQSRRATIIVSLFAAVSLAGIYYSMKPYWKLAPSADFLNESGSLGGVVVYQILFALWISIPAGALGWSIGVSDELGWPRWLVAAGGGCAAAWGLWKILGVLVVQVLDSAVPAASPVSVTLGLSALVLCVSGLILVRVRGRREVRTQRGSYREGLAADDEEFVGRAAIQD